MYSGLEVKKISAGMKAVGVSVANNFQHFIFYHRKEVAVFTTPLIKIFYRLSVTNLASAAVSGGGLEKRWTRRSTLVFASCKTVELLTNVTSYSLAPATPPSNGPNQ